MLISRRHFMSRRDLGCRDLGCRELGCAYHEGYAEKPCERPLPHTLLAETADSQEFLPSCPTFPIKPGL